MRTSIDSFIRASLFAATVFLSASVKSAPDASCDLNLTMNDASSDDAPVKSSTNVFLKFYIRQAGSKLTLPKELEHCGKSEEEKQIVFYEFARGIAAMEGPGKCKQGASDMKSASIAKNGGSRGIWQLSKNDNCSDHHLQNPENGREAAKCIVGLWQRKDMSKVIGNPYFGPCKRHEAKCQAMLETVKKKACGQATGGNLHTAKALIDWVKDDPRKAQGPPTAADAPAQIQAEHQ